MDYSKNIEYWSNRYNAPNVESFIFRFYGRILKYDFGIDGSKNERVFDFGCGQGGALKFFYERGFSVYGVDIAEQDIRVARDFVKKDDNYNHEVKFELISPEPFRGQKYFSNLFNGDEWIDIAVSIQTLDFLTDTDCKIVLNNIYNQMKPGAIIYASFNGTNLYYYKHSTELVGGDGLRQVRFNNGRVEYDLLLNFCRTREEMREKFSMFQPLYIDYYDSSFREEGSEFRWTFCGVKPAN